MSASLMILEMLSSGALVHAGHLASRFYQKKKALKGLDIEQVQDDILGTAANIDNYRAAEWNEKFLKFCNDKGIHCEAVGDFCVCKECMVKKEKRAAEARSARQNMDRYYDHYSSSSYGSSWGGDSGSSSDWGSGSSDW